MLQRALWVLHRVLGVLQRLLGVLHRALGVLHGVLGYYTGNETATPPPGNHTVWSPHPAPTCVCGCLPMGCGGQLALSGREEGGEEEVHTSYRYVFRSAPSDLWHWVDFSSVVPPKV